MTTTNTASGKGTDRRQLIANQIVGDSGICYFNPLIGQSAGETCANIEPIMALLYGLTNRNQVSEDMNQGVKLIVQAVWAAMQYEREVLSKEDEVTA